MSIIEIDGPYMAYFDYPEDFKLVRKLPRSIVYIADNPIDAVIGLNRMMDAIRAELDKHELSIIFWRVRPKLTWENEVDNRYKARCRIATHPELPESFFELM